MKRLWPILVVVLALPARVHGQTPYVPPAQSDNPYPYAEHEPNAKAFSLAKSADYLDGVARFWMQSNSCGACHANFAYVMARPVLSERSAPVLKQTRDFLENVKPHREFSFAAHSVAVAFSLAWDDAHTSGKLQAATHQALRRMWTTQQSYGSWEPMGCGRILPAENDGRFTAILAAVAAGVAPEGYARLPEAQDGLIKLRRYFVNYPARSVHEQALTLWASLHLDGLMTTAERQAAVKALLAKQRPDGGWSFHGLTGLSPTRGGAAPPGSDGYSTGLAIYVLREAGVPATRPAIVQGVNWLRGHQRVSGRWFTPSRAAGNDTEGGVGKRDLYVQNLGTAFTVLALKACEATHSVLPVTGPLQPTPGLLLRDWLIAE